MFFASVLKNQEGTKEKSFKKLAHTRVKPSKMMQLACARIKPHHVGIRLRAYLLSALLQSGPERAPRNRVYDENQGDVETIKQCKK